MVAIGRAIWVDLACKILVRQSLVRRNMSECHVAAVKLETALASPKRDGGIAMVLEHVVSAEWKAFKGGLKCMYFLNKSEIAHTTHFSHLKLGKSLGATYLQDMHVGGNGYLHI